ncbi:MAG: fimbrillin family protein [Rikenellaceae bacterium]
MCNFFMRFFACLALLWAVGCSGNSEDVLPESFYSELAITFGVDVDEQVELITKGVMIESSTDVESIGVYGGSSADGWDSDYDFNKMYNQQLNSDSITHEWNYVGDVAQWDDQELNSKYTFFAYSPFQTSANGVEPVVIGGELYVDYTMPSECSLQPDLMMAIPRKNITQPTSNNVELTFKHTLSSIGFSVVGSSTNIITQISINNIYAVGRVSINDSEEVSWQYLDNRSTQSFSAGISQSVTPDIYTSSSLTLNDGYLMVIPQDIEDVDIVIDVYDTQTEQTSTLTYSFSKGDSWQAGKVYEYTVNLSSYDYTIDGTSNCYMLHSDNQEQIFYIPVEGRINTFWRYYADDNQTYKDRLSSKDEWSVDVLWHDVDGGLGDFSAERAVSGFSPSVEVTSASAPDFTTIGTRSAMKITLPAKHKEGNIVLAVMLGGEVLWSWHLWITDYNPDGIVDNVSPVNSRLVYSASGYDGEVHRYEDDDLWGARGVYGDKFIMDRNLGARSSSYASDAKGVLHYQFGRKDPFPASDPVDGEVTIGRGNQQVSFLTAVQNPTTFYVKTSKPYSWSIEGSALSGTCIWDDKYIVVSSTSDDYAKSIFDPSPLGWKLPIYGTYLALDSNSCTSDSRDNQLVYNDEIYFPLTGYRSNNSGGVKDYGSQGNLRLATPIDESFAYNLAYSDSIIDTNNTRSDGFTVRCIEE